MLIPEYGATGAAFTAGLSGFVLCIAGFGLVRSMTGRVRLMRSLGGPTVAGGAAAAFVLLAGLPTIPAALGAVVIYAVGIPGVRAAGVPRRPERLSVAGPALGTAKRRRLGRRGHGRAGAGAPVTPPPLVVAYHGLGEVAARRRTPVG